MDSSTGVASPQGRGFAGVEDVRVPRPQVVIEDEVVRVAVDRRANVESSVVVPVTIARANVDAGLFEFVTPVGTANEEAGEFPEVVAEVT